MMRVAIGSDHAGYELKEHLKELLREANYAVTDLGTHSTESVDYPDYAAAVATAVLDDRADRGIVVCGTGAGAAIAANKLNGIRAAQATDTYTAHQIVEHDDVNVLALGGKITGQLVAWELVEAFIEAEFTAEERHVRRVQKIVDLENTAHRQGHEPTAT